MFLPVCSKKIKTSTTNKKEKTNQQYSTKYFLPALDNFYFKDEDLT